MTQAKTERLQQLMAFVAEEMSQFEQGDITSLTPQTVLAQKFGYPDYTGVSRDLARTGLASQRRFLSEQSRRSELLESYETAWMLGILVTANVLNTPHKRLVEVSGNEEFLQAFLPIADRFFQTDGAVSTRRRNIMGTERTVSKVLYRSAGIIAPLRDLRTPEWIETIRENHSWILRNPTYIWAFLAGMFERRGLLRIPDGKSRLQIGFNTLSPEVAVFVAELLAQVGIEKPSIRYDTRRSHGVNGILVSNFSDAQKLAEHLHSIVTEREVLLEQFRKLDPKKARYFETSFTEDELFSEYQRLVQMLGHEPSYAEIAELKKYRKTKYSATVYMSRFGDGNFSQARENLRERLEIRQSSSVIIRDSRQFIGYSSDEILDEWQRLTQFLGHEPGIREITELRRQGITKYSHSLYADRFGGEGGFSEARENIKRILASKAADSSVSK